MRKEQPLSPKQLRFVEEYLVDLNATQAAIRAGYSPRSAELQGFRLIRNDKLAALIAAAKEARSIRTKITQDHVLTELARIGFSQMSRYMAWSPDGVSIRASEELTEDEVAAVAEVKETVTENGRTISLKMHDKLGALRDLGRHLGLFKDKADVTLHWGKEKKDGAAEAIAEALGLGDLEAPDPGAGEPG